MSRGLDRLRRTLGHPAVLIAVPLLAALVNLPALEEPMSTDDLILDERLSDPATLGPAHYGRDLVPAGSHRFGAVVMRLFDWVGPDSEVEARTLMESGVYPWWASEEFLLAFWRPVSSATHWLDYRVWPDSEAAIHLHGILWFALAVAALTLLYRRLLPDAWVAGLAALLYAVDQNFFFPVAWMSNRNVLLCLLFGILALLAHHRWRADGSTAAAVAAQLWLALALLAGEPGVAITAYLFGYALFLDRGGWLRRAASLLPAFLVTVAWRLVYSALGYGALETGLYLDPGREPLRFLGAIVERAPLLLVGQLAWPNSSIYEFLAPPARLVMWGASVALLGVLGALLRPLLRHSRQARFWATGMVVSVLPICATSPVSDRRLFFVGIGGMALTALFLGGVVAGAPWRPASRAWRWAGGLAAAALLVVQLGLPARILAAKVASEPARGGTHAHLDLGHDPDLARQEVVLVSAPHTFLTVYLPWERAQAGEPVPRGLRLLAPAFSALELTRTGPREVELTTTADSLMEIAPPEGFDPAHDVYGVEWSNDGFWSGGFPLAVGERRDLPGMTAEVLEVDAEGWPRRVRFRFDRDLDGDPGRRWMAWSWDERRFVDLAPPPVGESVALGGPFG